MSAEISRLCFFVLPIRNKLSLLRSVFKSFKGDTVFSHPPIQTQYVDTAVAHVWRYLCRDIYTGCTDGSVGKWNLCLVPWIGKVKSWGCYKKDTGLCLLSACLRPETLFTQYLFHSQITKDPGICIIAGLSEINKRDDHVTAADLEGVGGRCQWWMNEEVVAEISLLRNAITRYLYP